MLCYCFKCKYISLIYYLWNNIVFFNNILIVHKRKMDIRAIYLFLFSYPFTKKICVTNKIL